MDYYNYNCSNFIKSNYLNIECYHNSYKLCCEEFKNKINIETIEYNLCNKYSNYSVIYNCKYENNYDYNYKIVEIFCIIGYIFSVFFSVTLFIFIVILSFKGCKKIKNRKSNGYTTLNYYDPL